MSRRIKIVLPDKTLAILDRVAPKGKRSPVISRAVLHFVEAQEKTILRDRLKREAIANAGRDVEMVAEWFPIEEEASGISAATAKRRP